MSIESYSFGISWYITHSVAFGVVRIFSLNGSHWELLRPLRSTEFVPSSTDAIHSTSKSKHTLHNVKPTVLGQNFWQTFRYFKKPFFYCRLALLLDDVFFSATSRIAVRDEKIENILNHCQFLHQHSFLVVLGAKFSKLSQTAVVTNMVSVENTHCVLNTLHGSFVVERLTILLDFFDQKRTPL